MIAMFCAAVQIELALHRLPGGLPDRALQAVVFPAVAWVDYDQPLRTLNVLASNSRRFREATAFWNFWWEEMVP